MEYGEEVVVENETDEEGYSLEVDEESEDLEEPEDQEEPEEQL